MPGIHTIRSLIAEEFKTLLKSPAIRQAIAQEAERAVARRLAQEAKRTAAPVPHDGPYLKVKEAAALMRCHTETVLRMIRDGRLSSVGEGKLLRIPRPCTSIFACSPIGRTRSVSHSTRSRAFIVE